MVYPKALHSIQRNLFDTPNWYRSDPFNRYVATYPRG